MTKLTVFLLLMVSLFMCIRAEATVLTYNGWAGDNDNIPSFIDGAGENYGSRISSSPVAYAGDAAISAQFDEGNGWTPNIEVAWDGGQPNNWDTYTGWRGEEVAQIQGSSPGNPQDVVFTPDAGHGVLVNSFDLDEWAGGGGCVVDWEVLDDTGTLASGTWTGETAGFRSTVYTGLTENDVNAGKVVTLRFMQTAGDDTYLAMDDTNFDQFTAEGATNPSPADGSMYEDTWVTLGWGSGVYAVSHDVYMADNFDDVNDGAAAAFQGNHAMPFLTAGFFGFPYPDGLVPGTTYYWRVDEVNDTEPNSPWSGDVWSFSISPKTAYSPDPPDGAEFVDPNAVFTWAPGFGAKLHTIYMGTNFDDVNNAAGGMPVGSTSYSPSKLDLEKVYYWRVDEFDPPNTYKGDVWAFTTPGAVGNPLPANGAADVQMIATLSWTPADNAASHELYFGMDADAVENATTTSPEYVGPKALGAESYDPGGLAWDSSYAWRVDEVYPTETIKGLVWSFATADFLLVDDFESYNDIDPPDPASNRIFDKWADGFMTPATNGALVGNALPPYAEQNVVHGGAQSMNCAYDNAGKTSEATLTLVWPRDWTEEGVTKLSLWFRGESANAADRMFVALGNAVVYHDDPAATQLSGWTEWVIDLAEFAGVDLANVGSITIGFGTRGAPVVTGGTGTVHFDDIGLIR